MIKTAFCGDPAKFCNIVLKFWRVNHDSSIMEFYMAVQNRNKNSVIVLYPKSLVGATSIGGAIDPHTYSS